MRLVERVKRIVAGHVNALLEPAEGASSERLMKEAIREIDRVADDIRDRLGVVLAASHQANKRLAEASNRHEELSAQAEAAIEEGRDDLARAAIARQLDLEAQLPVLEAALADASQEQSELEGYVAALSARRREMESDLEAFLASGFAPGTERSGKSSERRAAEADGAFNRAFAQATRAPGDAASEADAEVLAALERLALDNRVKERLAALLAERSRK